MQMTQLFKTGALCVAALALGLMPTQAQTTATWIGPATGGEWNTGASWDTGAPPLDATTNAAIGVSTNVSYSVPMAATSFGALAMDGILNVNASGFNCSSLVMKRVTGGSRLFINSGGAVNITGSLNMSTNSQLTLAAGGSLQIGSTLNIDNGTSSKLSGSGGIVTNSGGMLSANSTVLNNANGNGTGLFVISGGSNYLGAFSMTRANGSAVALGTEGLAIYGGTVNFASISLGYAGTTVGNSFNTLLVAGGAVTNAGGLTIQQATSARYSRFVQTGGWFVMADTNVVYLCPTATGTLNNYAVTGGTNLVGGFYFGETNGGIGTLNFTNSATVYVGSQGIGYNGAATLNAALNNGGLFGASSDWTNNAALTLGVGSFTFQTAGLDGTAHNITSAGVLKGGGTLIKTGGGVLELDAVNTYSGSTLVNAGTLVVGSAGSLASTLVLAGPGAKVDVSAATGGYTFNAGQTIAGFGVVTGAVNVASAAIVNPGSNVLTGTLTFANDLVETGGALNHFDLPAAPTGAGNDAVVVTGNLTVSGVNTVEINGASAAGAYKLFQYGNLSGSLANFSLTGVTGSLSNSVANNAIYLIITNSMRGPTNVVWIGNATANNWDMVTATNWLNNGALDFFVSGDNAWFTDAGAANPLVNLLGSITPTSVTVDATASYTFTGNGLLSGFGGLTKTNTGTLTVLTTNTYAGITTINGGVLAVAQLANGGQPSSIGSAGSESGSLVISNGTFRYIGSDVGVDRGATLASSASAIDVSVNGALTVGGVLAGSGSLTKTGNGTLILNNPANSYGGGTFINAGTLTVSNATALGAGLVTMNGGNLALGALKLANTINVAAPGVIIGGNSGGATGIKNVTGSANLTLAITGGTTFDLTGDMTAYSGTLTLSNVSGGFVRFNGSTGSQLATWDLGQQTMEINMRTSAASNNFGGLKGGVNTSLVGRSTTDNNGPTTHYIGWNGLNTTFDGALKSGASSQQFLHIVKVGTGTLTLRGANPYTGTTSVSNGVLALAYNPDTGTDGSIDGTSLINLQAGTALDVSGRSDGTLQLGGSQTLQGAGTIFGSLNASGTVAPGIGLAGTTGTLTVTNVVTLNGTTWLKLNRTASQNSDRLVSTHSGITYGGTLTVTNVGDALQVGDTFTLFSGSGLGAGTFTVTNLPATCTWDTSKLGVDGTIKVSGLIAPMAFSGITVSGSDLVLGAAGGTPGASVTVLTSTSLTLPRDQWTTVTTGSFDEFGKFSYTVTGALSSTETQQFYLLLMQ